jgi:hypothetical protein
MDDSYIFCNYKAIFTQSLRHFQHILPTLCKTLYTNAVKFPATSRAVQGNFKKLRKRMRIVRSNRIMKDVLLLHDNARPHTSLRTREAIAKMLWNVLPRPAHSPHLTPSDCHLFRPVKDALRGCHFADDKELRQSFRDVHRSRGWEFYSISIQRLTQCWKTCVENDGNFVQKQPYNCKRCMNHPCKFHCYCNDIFWEKIGGFTFVPHLEPCRASCIRTTSIR